MGNIGINANQHMPVSKPSIVRLKMNRGVDNGAGTAPSVQFGKTPGDCTPVVKSFSAYNLSKPAPNVPQPPTTLGANLPKFGGLNAAGGGQLGNKAVFNLYEMVSLMITLSNSLNRTFREQMAARVVGEISKLHDEARTLTNAAYTARTMGIASAAAGGAMAFASLGGTFATGFASKNAKTASGLDVANKAFEKAKTEMKPLQGFVKAQGDIGAKHLGELDKTLGKTFGGNKIPMIKGNPKADIATRLEQKTMDIREYADNKKAIADLQGKLKADGDLKAQKQPAAPDLKEKKVEIKNENEIKNDENNINNINNDKIEKKQDNEGIKEIDDKENIEKNEVQKEDKNEALKEDKGEALKEDKGKVQKEGENQPEELSDERRAEIKDQIKELTERNKELDAKYNIEDTYCKNGETDPIKAYRQELHDRFEGKFKEEDPAKGGVKKVEPKEDAIKKEDLKEDKIEKEGDPLDSFMSEEPEEENEIKLEDEDKIKLEDEGKIKPEAKKGKIKPDAKKGEPKPKGFNAEVDGEKGLNWHPLERRAMKNAGAKWLERQDALLDGGTQKTEMKFAGAQKAVKNALNVYRYKMENSKAAIFTQTMSSFGQGLAPMLQLLSGGAGVNELANAQTKDLQAGERADSYNASEMQTMKDSLKGIVDGALQVMSTAVSSFAQFQSTVNSNFRA